MSCSHAFGSGSVRLPSLRAIKGSVTEFRWNDLSTDGGIIVSIHFGEV